MDSSLPGSSVYGIFQARILEWVAISFFSGASWPRDWAHIFCVSCTGGWFFTTEPRGKPSSLSYFDAKLFMNMRRCKHGRDRDWKAPACWSVAALGIPTSMATWPSPASLLGEETHVAPSPLLLVALPTVSQPQLQPLANDHKCRLSPAGTMRRTDQLSPTHITNSEWWAQQILLF